MHRSKVAIQMGFELGVLKGVFPLQGVTGAKPWREERGPHAEARVFSSRDDSEPHRLRSMWPAVMESISCFVGIFSGSPVRYAMGHENCI